MAVRQYIGARYVPKIYENSLNPSSMEWENTSYEPFTIVAYLNNSYISRDFVPENSGAPNTNIAHWAILGFTSGQIAQLQQDVSDLQADVSRIDSGIQGRRFLFVGDSYDGVVAGHSWTGDCISILGLSDSVVVAHGGYGFIANGTKTWKSMLEAETITDEDTITDIVICGGANDAWAADQSQLPAAMQTFDAYVKGRFAGLKRIYCGFAGNSFKTDQVTIMRSALRHYVEGAKRCGWIYLNGIENTLLFSDYVQQIGADDFIHPSAHGVDQLGANVAECILSGSCHNYHENAAVTITLNDSLFSAGTLTIGERLTDNILNISMPNKAVTNTSSLSGLKLLGTCDPLTNMMTAKFFNVVCMSNGVCYPIPLLFNNYNELYISLPSGVTIPANQGFTIQAFTYSFDLISI